MQFEVEIYDFHLQHLKIGSFHSCECRGKKIKEHCTILHTIAYYLDFRYTLDVLINGLGRKTYKFLCYSNVT